MDDRWFTIEQVMVELEVCRRTVFYLVQRGKLTRLKTPVGRKRTFFIAAQVRSLKEPTIFDPSSASDDEMRRLNEGVSQAMREWLDKQQME